MKTVEELDALLKELSEGPNSCCKDDPFRDEENTLGGNKLSVIGPGCSPPARFAVTLNNYLDRNRLAVLIICIFDDGLDSFVYSPLIE